MATRLLVILVCASLIGDALGARSGFQVAITAGPRPQPVMVNGKKHLVYELHLTNLARIPIEVVNLEICGDEESKPLAIYRDEALARLITTVENLLTTRNADDVAKARTM